MQNQEKQSAGVRAGIRSGVRAGVPGGFEDGVLTAVPAGILVSGKIQL
jgi:hypothetical protein